MLNILPNIPLELIVIISNFSNSSALEAVQPGIWHWVNTVRKQNSTEQILKILLAIFEDS